MGNAGCCNADREERLQIDSQIAGANPEGAKSRGHLKGAGMDGSFTNAGTSEQEIIIKNHSGNQPENTQQVDTMMPLSSEAQSTLEVVGAFQNA